MLRILASQHAEVENTAVSAKIHTEGSDLTMPHQQFIVE